MNPANHLRFLARALLGLLLLLSTIGASASTEFLRPAEAFKSEAVVSGNNLVVNFKIADTYYLYRKRFKVRTSNDAVVLGDMVIPAGTIKDDEYFGKSEVYYRQVAINVPLSLTRPVSSFVVEVASQGCADAGLCYPPETRKLEVRVPPGFAVAQAAPTSADTSPAPGNQISNANSVDQKKVDALSALLGVSAPASDKLPAASSATGKSSTNPLAALANAIGNSGQAEFLDPEVAFKLETRVAADGQFYARWDIADAYYLYRNKFAFAVVGADILASPHMAKGKLKHDEYFGEVEVYYGQAEAAVPFRARPDGDTVAVEVTYQGCADAGLCYPPIKKTFTHKIPSGFSLISAASASEPGSGAAGTSGSTSSSGVSSPGANAIAPTAMVSEQDRLTKLLAGGNLWLIVAAFFGGGLLLSLTPCVFPMVPILSSIIVGQGEPLSRTRAFILSFIYVQGMAFTYTVVGIVAGKTGANLQIIFQDPFVLTTFAAVFVLLALGMFGFYELQLPASWQARLSEVSNRQQGGSYVGVAVMGVLSALIVGPCVAPPLFGALAYISTTGDAVLGGAALYALSMGMGVPLLIVGVSAGTLLPRAGAWMDAVKGVFGVALLAVAIFFMERILPGWISMLLWATLLIVSAIYMGALDQLGREVSGWQRLWKGTGLVLMTYGVLLMVGGSIGNTDPLQPLKNVGVASSGASQPGKLAFRWVKGPEGLDAALREASAAGRPAMLDYYADWCIACKELDKYTFSDPAVQAALSGAVLLKTDVTANDAADIALNNRYRLYGPPTIQFFDRNGKEREPFRVVGFMPADEFSAHAARALALAPSTR